MEDKKAFEFLYKKAIQNNHKELANHIKRIGPLKIKLSKMSFVDHLSKIVVGQQLSVKSAAAIWARTEILLKANKYKKPNEKLNIKFKKAGLSRQKIEYLNGIIFNKEIINVTKKELKNMTPSGFFDFLISSRITSSGQRILINLDINVFFTDAKGLLFVISLNILLILYLNL